MMAVVSGPVDFFVSYTSADRPWAEWIAWELEQAGHSVIVQAWDMQPGSNFVAGDGRSDAGGERTMAVLSPAFVESRVLPCGVGGGVRTGPGWRDRRAAAGAGTRCASRTGYWARSCMSISSGLEPGPRARHCSPACEVERAKPPARRRIPAVGRGRAARVAPTPARRSSTCR